MSENATARPSFGRALGEVSAKIRKLHHGAIAEFDSDFPSWILLTLLRDAGGPLPVGEVIADLNARIDLAAAEAEAVLARAAAAGYVDYRAEDPAGEVRLTDAGGRHFAAMYTRARQATDAATSGIDPAALDAALTVLLAIDERATALLA